MDIFGIKKLKADLYECGELSESRYRHIQILEKEMESLKLEVKIAKMYANDDEAINELLECKKKKEWSDLDTYRELAYSQHHQEMAAQQRAASNLGMGNQSGLVGLFGNVI